jgi:hypothetical protein
MKRMKQMTNHLAMIEITMMSRMTIMMRKTGVYTNAVVPSTVLIKPTS